MVKKEEKKKVKGKSEVALVRLPDSLNKEFRIVCLAQDKKPGEEITRIVSEWTESQKKKIGLVYTSPKGESEQRSS